MLTNDHKCKKLKTQIVSRTAHRIPTIPISNASIMIQTTKRSPKNTVIYLMFHLL